MRKTIIEKYKKWSYLDLSGIYVWLDKYGDISRMEDNKGVEIIIYKKHGINREPGIVFMPYLPLVTTQQISQEDLCGRILSAATVISRYAVQTNKYIIVSSRAAGIIDDLSQ